MAEEIKKKGNQINIELSEEISEGTYSNLAIISHSNSEFVLDFVRIVPNVQKAKVKSRIILSPEHAKRLHKALADNINKYEAQNNRSINYQAVAHTNNGTGETINNTSIDVEISISSDTTISPDEEE